MEADRNEALRLADALEAYNRWRRGGDGEQPDPSRLGAEIEAAAALLRRLAEGGWRPIEEAPKDGTEVWAFNGEQACMRWIEGSLEGETYALWVWVDELLADADPHPKQPTHFQPLPAAPSATQQGDSNG